MMHATNRLSSVVGDQTPQPLAQSIDPWTQAIESVTRSLESLVQLLESLTQASDPSTQSLESLTQAIESSAHQLSRWEIFSKEKGGWVFGTVRFKTTQFLEPHSIILSFTLFLVKQVASNQQGSRVEYEPRSSRRLEFGLFGQTQKSIVVKVNHRISVQKCHNTTDYLLAH